MGGGTPGLDLGLDWNEFKLDAGKKAWGQVEEGFRWVKEGAKDWVWEPVSDSWRAVEKMVSPPMPSGSPPGAPEIEEQPTDDTAEKDAAARLARQRKSLETRRTGRSSLRIPRSPSVAANASAGLRIN